MKLTFIRSSALYPLNAQHHKLLGSRSMEELVDECTEHEAEHEDSKKDGPRELVEICIQVLQYMNIAYFRIPISQRMLTHTVCMSDRSVLTTVTGVCKGDSSR